MSSLITVLRAKLFEVVPDNKTTPWAEILTNLGEHRSMIEAVVFGKPDQVARKGNNFVCTGKTPASTTINGFRLFSESVVTFSMKPTGSEIVVTDLSGISVEPPTGLARFKLSHAKVKMSTQPDELLLSTTKFLIPVTMVIDVKTGSMNRWYIG
jgi:hypothetical protein